MHYLLAQVNLAPSKAAGICHIYSTRTDHYELYYEQVFCAVVKIQKKLTIYEYAYNTIFINIL